MVNSEKKIAVVAFGGNALLPETQEGTFEEQQANADAAAESIIGISRNGYDVILVHGNGPQVGQVLVQNEESSEKVPMQPLDACVAATQGTIGYILTTALRRTAKRLDVDVDTVTVLTNVAVSPADPAFENPTKPIGSFMSAERAQEMEKTKGWKIIEDAGRGYRRVVPSPKPRRIMESKAIRELAQAGNIVIACGGGGIPVARVNDEFVGLEAVIDKDLASSLLAEEIGADLYIVLTGVSQVAINFGKPNMKLLDRITVSEAEKYMAEGHFPPGSMGPKIAAALKFIKSSGKEVLITSAEKLEDALKGQSGTYIIPDAQ
ncbi:carbamate kinase [Desulfitobacterium dehalogenans ATCC 51507]|uniref:Carbamate kinase n=1 Tax=Desulfitobacterium dehalogenans (strain ATCC 51507 / DSM 9161 / JW/IU-DC1) TaxID=756499 RepID=I4A5J2_DESDJ|nr:carbamate kinase [Desulfitobacterium dehalogenans]AFL99226.1 carbamate kinase [Desulfitobacterium dehalogenans ATCC 51507]